MYRMPLNRQQKKKENKIIKTFVFHATEKYKCFSHFNIGILCRGENEQTLTAHRRLSN